MHSTHFARQFTPIECDSVSFLSSSSKPFSNWILLLVALCDIVKMRYLQKPNDNSKISAATVQAKPKLFQFVIITAKMRSGKRYGGKFNGVAARHCASFHNKFSRIHHTEWLQISIYLHFFFCLHPDASSTSIFARRNFSISRNMSVQLQEIDFNSIAIVSVRRKRHLFVFDERK